MRHCRSGPGWGPRMRHVSEVTVANLLQATAGPSSAAEAESALLMRMRRFRQIEPLPAASARSWQRCLDEYGLNPDAPPSPMVHDGSGPRERQQRLEEVLRIAKVEMENLYEQSAGGGYAVVFADAEATLLHSVQDPALLPEFRQTGLFCGASGSERYQGSNGIGTCAVERSALGVQRGEHYLARHLPLSCSGARSSTPTGNCWRAGCVNVGRARHQAGAAPHQRAGAHVGGADRAFVFPVAVPAWVDPALPQRPEFAGLHEALMAIGPDECVLAVKRSGAGTARQGRSQPAARSRHLAGHAAGLRHRGAACTQRCQHAVVDPLCPPRTPLLRPGAAAAPQRYY
nr:hypothetical protein [Xanthomonas vasicola]